MARSASPWAGGRISSVRRVDRTGTINLPGQRLAVGLRRAGQYVVATLYAHRQQIAVKLDARVVERCPCLIRGKIAPRLCPLPPGQTRSIQRCYGGAQLGS